MKISLVTTKGEVHICFKKLRQEVPVIKMTRTQWSWLLARGEVKLTDYQMNHLKGP